MFTYWWRVCRHGAVTVDRRRASRSRFPLSTSLLCSRVRTRRAVLRVRVCRCVERKVGGGRRVGKQVAPKPQPWAVAVKYCGCFKNRSFRPCSTSPAPPGPSLLGDLPSSSVSTLCREICGKTESKCRLGEIPGDSGSQRSSRGKRSWKIVR